jgi:hypothetical protein
MPDYPTIRIVFSRERSRHYDDIVDECKRLGENAGNDYMQGGRGHSIRHVLLTSDPSTAGRIWDRVERWNSVKIFIDGERASVREFKDLRERARRERRKRWLVGGILLVVVGAACYLVVGGL